MPFAAGLWFYGSFCLYGNYSSTASAVPLPCKGRKGIRPFAMFTDGWSALI